MRIGCDVRPFLRQATGVGIYYKNLLFALAQIDRHNFYYLFSSSFKERFHPEEKPMFNRCEFRDARFPVAVVNFLWHRLGWPPLDTFFGTRLDLTHSPTPLVLPTKGKKIVTVHDLFFMDFPESVQKEAGKNFSEKIEGSLQRADGVIVVSQFIKNQVIDLFRLDEGKIKVIYHGVDPAFFQKPSDAHLESVKREYGLPSEFIFFAGTIEPRKNLVKLIEALALIQGKKRGLSLVIAGKKGLDYQNCLEKINDLKLQSRVLFLDYLPIKDLQSLYYLASCLVFPSKCEGFGLPLLEAMAAGCPLVISRSSALPEIAGNAALYFDPENKEEMAAQISMLLADGERRQSLIQSGENRIRNFSWKQTAESTLDFYMAVHEREKTQ